MESLPKPTGPYQVGIQKFNLYDENRPELFYPKGRLIPVQFYFPTKKGKHKLHPKIFEEHTPNVFSEVFYHVYSSKIDMSNLNNKQHSLIFLNHGLTASMTDYAAIAEDLASNGYIVVTIQHQLDTDLLQEPAFWKFHSFSLHARFIDNILYVFEWIKLNKKDVFYNKINYNKVGFVGHSLGSNAVLLLASRASGFLKNQPTKTLLPRENNIIGVTECIIIFDYEISFAYPQHTQYPMLFIFSEERKKLLEGSGLFDDLITIGHKVNFYVPSKHISYLDQGYIDPKDPCKPNLCYFDGTDQQRKEFFDKIRHDIRKFLKDNEV